MTIHAVKDLNIVNLNLASALFAGVEKNYVIRL